MSYLLASLFLTNQYLNRSLFLIAINFILILSLNRTKRTSNSQQMAGDLLVLQTSEKSGLGCLGIGMHAKSGKPYPLDTGSDPDIKFNYI